MSNLNSDNKSNENAVTPSFIPQMPQFMMPPPWMMFNPYFMMMMQQGMFMPQFPYQNSQMPMMPTMPCMPSLNQFQNFGQTQMPMMPPFFPPMMGMQPQQQPDKKIPSFEEFQKQMMSCFKQMASIQSSETQEKSETSSPQKQESVDPLIEQAKQTTEQKSTEPKSQLLVDNQSEEQQKVSKVKHPTTCFMFFFQQMRTKINDTHPGVSSAKLAQFLGQKWHELSQEEKKPYQELAAQSLKQYQLELQEEIRLNGGQRLMTKGQVTQMKKKTAGNKEQRRKQTPPHLLYYKHRLAELADEKRPYQEKRDQIAIEWHNMSKEEQANYQFRDVQQQSSNIAVVKVNQEQADTKGKEISEKAFDTTQSHSPNNTVIVCESISEEANNQFNPDDLYKNDEFVISEDQQNQKNEFN